MFNIHLPTIEFIAGDTCPFIFDLRDIGRANIFTSSCTAHLSVSYYINDGSAPIVTKTKRNLTITDAEDLTFELEPADTINMRGKYVYQLMLTNGRDSEIYEGNLIVFANRNAGMILS